MRDRWRIFYAADIHGSEVCFRKWLNAAEVCKADVLILGGDIAGKMIIPILERGGGRFACELFGQRIEVEDTDHLRHLQRRIRAMGGYDLILSPEEKDRLDRESGVVAEEVFPQVIGKRVRSWLELAEERLSQGGRDALWMLGNDDYPHLASLIGGTHIHDVDERIIELPGGFEMISFGQSNRTPWNTPRELDEPEIARRLEALAGQVTKPERAVFNLHCPPYGTHIDQAPALDENLRPKVQGGTVLFEHVGSTAIRHVLERFQPMLGLHGHIHEASGGQKLGKTLVLNPGSDYANAILKGAIVNLDARKGLRSWQLVQG